MILPFSSIHLSITVLVLALSNILLWGWMFWATVRLRRQASHLQELREELSDIRNTLSTFPKSNNIKAQREQFKQLVARLERTEGKTRRYDTVMDALLRELA